MRRPDDGARIATDAVDVAGEITDDYQRTDDRGAGGQRPLQLRLPQYGARRGDAVKKAGTVSDVQLSIGDRWRAVHRSGRRDLPVDLQARDVARGQRRFEPVVSRPGHV